MNNCAVLLTREVLFSSSLLMLSLSSLCSSSLQLVLFVLLQAWMGHGGGHKLLATSKTAVKWRSDTSTMEDMRE